MRPDQHKKKKNEQYKKKHNIKTEDSKKNTGKGKHERSAEKSENSRSEPVAKETHKAPAQRVTNAEVDKYFEEVQPEFRKRTIQSNWDRYEVLPPEDDDAEMRGADFQALLDATSSSVAQFQFDEEKDWMVEAEDWSKDCDGWLSLDVQDLSAAMLTIPLHERLCIAKELFQDEQIKEFQSSAARHLDKYNSVSTSDQQEAKEESQAKLLNTLIDDKPKDEQEDTDILDDILGGVDVGTRDLRHGEESNPEKSDNIEDDLDDLLSGTASKPASSTPCSLDNSTKVPTDSSNNDKDKLNDNKVQLNEIKVDNNEKAGSPVTQESKKFEKKPVASSNLEDDLEELLNLDSPAHVPKPAPTANANDELDDWLDSVLDD